MDEKTKSPITLMAEALAKMTERAIEAERERDDANNRANNWYQICQGKDAQLQAAEAKLADLREYLEEMKKGTTNNA